MRTQAAWLLAIQCATSAAEKFSLKKTYNAGNFFDSFEFNTTGTITTQADDNKSWVQYQNLSNARDKGLAKVENGDVYLGIDHTTVLDANPAAGRDSLRVISKEAFRYGLIITRFTHLPAQVCGGWPAYWTLGVGQWPKAGEIDMYEGWNFNMKNKPAIHVGPAAEFGDCQIGQDNQKAKVLSKNCDNESEDRITQWKNQGCQSQEDEDSIWASSNGGIQALEWTKDHINLFTWPHAQAPENLDDSELDTSSWGKPSVQIRASNCNIEKSFQKQKIMFTLPVCGNPVEEVFWTIQDGGSGQTCHNRTGGKTCRQYVAENPQDFKNFYFKIKDIRYFDQKVVEPTSHTRNATSTSTVSLNPTSSATSLTSTMSINHTSIATSLTATLSKNQTSFATPSTLSPKNQTRITTTASTMKDDQKATKEAATATSTASKSRVSCKAGYHLRHK